MEKERIIDVVSNSIIPIAIISIILLFFVFAFRLLFHVMLWISSLFYVKGKNARKINKKMPKTDVSSYKKEEDELLRDQKSEEKKLEEEFKLDGVQRIGEDFAKQVSFLNEDKIVGIAKPIGFWTSLILGDQLSQILGRASALNDRSHKGFWVSMLEAQSRGLGRKNSRSL
ncbi:MAG: hypothetical protein PHY80_00890 [Rickettsiales bacterium]|nr:hypothetical protein [Rickettsiales bacterium]